MSKTNLDHISSNKSNTTGPARRGVVENVMNSKVIMHHRKLVQILLQQDVLPVDIGKDQVNLGLVFGVPEDGLDDLQHWGDAGSTSDHTESADEIRAVVEVTLGTLDADGLADLEAGDVLGDVTGRIRLDQEGELAFVVVRGNWGIGADDFLAINVGGDGDMLANRETENVIGTGEVKAVAIELISSCRRRRV